MTARRSGVSDALVDPAALPDLPVRSALPDIVAALDAHGAAVLVAAPGTGKTTLVPLALPTAAGRVVPTAAGRVVPTAAGRVLVAEPRRLAARAAAARMAALLGEPVGRRVGYAVRGDSRTSADTRVEVVTSGLLLRRLAVDPELPGVDTVLLDECHERHLDADLLLALLLDARAGLRPDLRLLATSATVGTDRLAALLGTAGRDAPVLRLDARAFPVDVGHVPPARRERLEACVARAVRAALADGAGDVLAFLPGVAEIRRTTTALTGALSGADVDVLPLHGRLPAAAQDAALRPGSRRRVVLSTAVAESSLTVPGVRAVVDGGLARVPRVDHRRGLAGLATVRVSAAVAVQRAGRAGREAPGRAYRCWPAGEQLAPFPEPEIRTADLTRLALDLAVWGTPDGRALRWWDVPPDGPLRAGQEVLRALGAVDGSGAATDRGRAMAAVGLHPRLARALLDGTTAVGARSAAEVVALLDDDTLGDHEVDADAVLARLRAGSAPAAGRWRAEAARLVRLAAGARPATWSRVGEPDRPGTATGIHEAASGGPGPSAAAGDAVALVIALAHPERLARRRARGSVRYLMAGGTAAELPPGSPLGNREWLAVAEATRAPGDDHARVRLAAPADLALAEMAAPALRSEGEEVAWVDGDVVARRVRRLGAIVLAEARLPHPDPEAVRDALLTGLRSEGLGLLRWDARARSLRDRLATLHRALGPPWPAVDDAALLADPDRWAFLLAEVRTRAGLARVDAAAVLRAVVDPRLVRELDTLAPERLAVPSGSRVAVDYSGERPVLAVRVQEVFGATATPTVAGGRLPVVLSLLSPAGRPAAVTGDLASFWTTGYPQVRAELRGRYPKHDWPVDPLAAAPTSRPTRQRRG
jgi:ATP-dependent helicase HrpB